MYTVQEALQELQDNGITDSIQMVRRWLREGVLQGERSDDRKAGWKISTDELARFIATRQPAQKLQRLEAEVARLKDACERLQREHNVTCRNIKGSEPICRPQTIEELWSMRLIDHSNVPDDILQQARRVLDQHLPEIKTTVQYICPFTGKRFGSMDKLIRAAIPFVIASTVAEHHRQEERRIRKQEQEGTVPSIFG